MKNPNTLVFVYGTLRRGGSNHCRMDGSEHVTHATTKGHLYQIDWYPGLVLDPDGSTVHGEVYAVPEQMLDALDEYEGPEYRRIQHQVTNKAGETFDVWIWEWNQPTDGLELVPDGDWLLVSST